VQLDPIKPTLKAPGIKRLKLIRDDKLSNFAFKFNLRCYSEAKPFGRAVYERKANYFFPPWWGNAGRQYQNPC